MYTPKTATIKGGMHKAPIVNPTSVQRRTKSSYAKYKCQYHKKAILTKLSNDSGYPQDILNYPISSHPPQDYLNDNKKNLKNFF